jgi:anti-sigma B factor antagonist
LLIMIDDEQIKRILIDLSTVMYADSSGLGALLLGLRQDKAQEKSFAVFGAQNRVRSLLHIARLDDVLISYKDETEAFTDKGK